MAFTSKHKHVYKAGNWVPCSTGGFGFFFLRARFRARHATASVERETSFVARFVRSPKKPQTAAPVLQARNWVKVKIPCVIPYESIDLTKYHEPEVVDGAAFLYNKGKKKQTTSLFITIQSLCNEHKLLPGFMSTFSVYAVKEYVKPGCFKEKTKMVPVRWR